MSPLSHPSSQANDLRSYLAWVNISQHDHYNRDLGTVLLLYHHHHQQSHCDHHNRDLVTLLAWGYALMPLPVSSSPAGSPTSPPKSLQLSQRRPYHPPWGCTHATTCITKVTTLAKVIILWLNHNNVVQRPCHRPWGCTNAITCVSPSPSRSPTSPPKSSQSSQQRPCHPPSDWAHAAGYHGCRPPLPEAA